MKLARGLAVRFRGVLAQCKNIYPDPAPAVSRGPNPQPEMHRNTPMFSNVLSSVLSDVFREQTQVPWPRSHFCSIPRPILEPPGSVEPSAKRCNRGVELFRMNFHGLR